MLISIIISAYNGEKYISQCVKSFFNQTYKNIELILVDDASVDNTKAIMYQLQSNSPCPVHVLVCSKNNGPGGGKNEGLKCAHGDYVFFCDCDDYVETSYISNLVEKAQHSNFPDIVFSGFKKIDEKGKTLYTRSFSNAHTALYQAISDWGKLFKLSYLKSNNLELPYGKVLEDVMFRAVVICTNPTISLCSATGYRYTLNKNSVSQTYMKKFIRGVMKDEIEYLKRQQHNIKPEYTDLYIYFVYQVMCWHILKSGSGVGHKQMRNEYLKMKNYLLKYFPDYTQNKFLCKKQPQDMRRSIKFAVKIIFQLDKIGLALPLLLIYSSFNFDRIWPKM